MAAEVGYLANPGMIGQRSALLALLARASQKVENGAIPNTADFADRKRVNGDQMERPVREPPLNFPYKDIAGGQPFQFYG